MAFIKTFKAGEKVQGYFLCKYKQILKNKNGKDYCSIRLQDHTGTIDGKIWAMHAGIEAFAINDVIYIEAEVLMYQDNLQLNISKVAQTKEGDYELETLMPHTTREVVVLEKQLYGFIDQIQDVAIKTLLEKIFYDEEIYRTFLKAGAAKSVHHAYISGLLEHTVTVTELGMHMSHLYHGVNRDLVIAGCLLHDIGKLQELSPFPENDYTDKGQLLGHITLGFELVHDYARSIENFPEETLMLLKHIIIAHHGEYEYGSPRRPKCIEAMIVHLADYSDSKVKMLEEMLETASTDEVYVGYNKILGRNIRRTTL